MTNDFISAIQHESADMNCRPLDSLTSEPFKKKRIMIVFTIITMFI